MSQSPTDKLPAAFPTALPLDARASQHAQTLPPPAPLPARHLSSMRPPTFAIVAPTRLSSTHNNALRIALVCTTDFRRLTCVSPISGSRAICAHFIPPVHRSLFRTGVVHAHALASNRGSTRQCLTERRSLPAEKLDHDRGPALRVSSSNPLLAVSRFPPFVRYPLRSSE